MAESKWTNRLSRLSLRLGQLALVIAFIGLTLARYDLVPKLAGFSALLGGGLIALVGLVAGFAGVILNWKHPSPSRRAAIIGLILSLGYVAFIASRPLSAGGAPAIHDVTTDLSDPPAFTRLPLRSDNLAGVGTVDNWRKVHAAAYGDLKPVRIAKPVAAVIADAERLARVKGWDIALADPAAGRLEATASVSYIRFKDDVVLRARATDGGEASIVDMRSVSRIGVGDLGVNARRIRAFLHALQST